MRGAQPWHHELVTGWSQGQPWPPPRQPGGILVPVPVSVPSWGRECEDFSLPSPARGQDLTGASLYPRHVPRKHKRGDRQPDNSLLGTQSDLSAETCSPGSRHGARPGPCRPAELGLGWAGDAGSAILPTGSSRQSLRGGAGTHPAAGHGGLWVPARSLGYVPGIVPPADQKGGRKGREGVNALPGPQSAPRWCRRLEPLSVLLCTTLLRASRASFSWAGESPSWQQKYCSPSEGKPRASTGRMGYPLAPAAGCRWKQLAETRQPVQKRGSCQRRGSPQE